ncbi:MAG TPA: hypothetical protein VFK38_07005 [Candidatus Limnocylindrales bacterium]|nr:hypothetical protein [Candidatus Limnocylindrales bacterium]
MRRTIALAAAVVLTVAVSLPAAASHSWGSYHWARTANPFTLQLGDNVSGTWDGHLGVASTDWSKATVLNTTIVTGGSSNKRCSATTGRVEVCNGKYGYNGWLGVAQIWVSGSHITKSTVKVNDSYFNSPTYNSPAWRQFVMCQEVGHAFGLDHTDETFDNANDGTCMDYTNDPDGGPGGASNNDPSNEHPNQHDYDQLATIYSHTDSTTTVGAAAPGGPGRGNSSRHVFREANGVTRIVWVLWTGSPRTLTAADLD